MTPGPVLLEAQHVTQRFRLPNGQNLEALRDVSLAVCEQEVVALVGPSGCGKSTLLNLMGLLDAPTKGQVVLDGAPVGSYRDRDVARVRNEKIGFIFQSFHLVADLTVQDNVELPLLYRKIAAKERKKRALAALEQVGLASRVHHFPGQLSGGQQQRVAIARAIVGEPRILLADEPTGNLDSQMADEVMAILHRINRDAKTTIAMVTHDPRLAESTDRVVRMFDGRQVQ